MLAKLFRSFSYGAYFNSAHSLTAKKNKKLDLLYGMIKRQKTISPYCLQSCKHKLPEKNCQSPVSCCDCTTYHLCNESYKLTMNTHYIYSKRSRKTVSNIVNIVKLYIIKKNSNMKKYSYQLSGVGRRGSVTLTHETYIGVFFF